MCVPAPTAAPGPSWPTHCAQLLPIWKEMPGVGSNEGEREDSQREITLSGLPCVCPSGDQGAYLARSLGDE